MGINIRSSSVLLLKFPTGFKGNLICVGTLRFTSALWQRAPKPGARQPSRRGTNHISGGLLPPCWLKLTFANQNELPWHTARLPFIQKFRTNFGFNPKPEIFIIFCFRTFFLLRNEFITLQLTGSLFLPFVFKNTLKIKISNT